MTALEFANLTKKDQELILWNNKGPVSFRITETHKIILQKVNDFYVETYFTYPETNGIDKINVISTMADLEPFLFKKVPKDKWKTFKDFLEHNDLSLI